MIGNTQIPVLDCSAVLSAFGNSTEARSALQNFARQLGEGIETMGMVYLINHGVGGVTVNKLRTKCKEFFQLPNETKAKYKKPNPAENYNGYSPFGAQTISNVTAPENRVEDLRECYDFTLPKSQFIFPAEVPDWKSVVENFTMRLTELSKILLRCFAIYLNLNDEEALVKIHAGIDNISIASKCNLRCNNYFSVKSSDTNNLGKATRLAAHRDLPTMALLFQDSVGGLEAETLSGEWISVPSIDNALILNSGFMMELFSGGRLLAVNHRVRLIEDSERLRQSFVFFVHPDNSAICKSLLDKKNTWTPIYPYVENEKYIEFFGRLLQKYVNFKKS